MKFAASKDVDRTVLADVNFLSPIDVTSYESILVDDKGLQLKDWLKATLEKHVAEDTPPFHGKPGAPIQ